MAFQLFATPVKQIMKYFKLLQEYYLIKSSGFFDSGWYLRNYPDVATKKTNSIMHYLRFGSGEGRDPGPGFSTSWYCNTYSDVKKVEINPLVHYLKYGRKEGRAPKQSQSMQLQSMIEDELLMIRLSGLFDEAKYLENNPDVTEAGVDPLTHYYCYGGFEGRDLPPGFYGQWYMDVYDDVKPSGLNPLIHYLKIGQKEGRKPTPPVYHLLSMWEYANQLNSIVFEETPEKIYLKCPKVGGGFQGILDEGEAYLPKPYIATLKDVIIFGGSDIVLTEEILLSDEISEFRSNEFGKKTSRVKSINGDSVNFVYNQRPVRPIEKGILLSCGHDVNYFHWLVECLPKLVFIDSIKQYKQVPLLIVEGLHENLMEALKRVNVNQRSLIKLDHDVPYQVDHLIYSSGLSRILDRYSGKLKFDTDIILSPKWISKVVSLLRSDSAHVEKPQRKLFLPRRKGLRLLGNQDEIESILSRDGFESVDLDDVSLDYQIELFSQASILVAPTGAALTNMLFCPPGTKVLILMSNHEITNYYFWSQLGDIAGLDVEIITGQRLYHLTNHYSVHDDYTIDPKIVLQKLKNYG